MVPSLARAGTRSTAHHASPGGGLFLAPLAGVSGFVGTGQTTPSGPVGPEVTTRSSFTEVALAGGPS
ncbi:MAG: hypothetical protein EOO75_07460 [Myxococcales bacterium]|nr:MAG: hypothetical protein EOO75_07460 [Myxococcales bacterium]